MDNQVNDDERVDNNKRMYNLIDKEKREQLIHMIR